MAKNLWLKRFDPKGEYVARRPFGKYGVGDHVESHDFTLRRLRQFYDNRMIVFADVWAEYVNPALVVPRVERKATLILPDFAPLPGLETLLPTIVGDDTIKPLETLLPALDESGTGDEQTGDESGTETLDAETVTTTFAPLETLSPLIVDGSITLPAIGETVQETATLPVVGEPVVETVTLPAAVPGINEPSTADLEARAKLISDAEALGVKLDKRWGNARIQAEIDKALA